MDAWCRSVHARLGKIYNPCPPDNARVVVIEESPGRGVGCNSKDFSPNDLMNSGTALVNLVCGLSLTYAARAARLQTASATTVFITRYVRMSPF